MASNGTPGVIALAAVASIACIAWWVAHARGAPVGKATPTTDPGYEFHEAGARKDKIDCMAILGSCTERVQACETQRAHCESDAASAHQQLQEAYAELADLRPKAALPVCSGRKEWIHAVLPTVQCHPYACGDTPFSCTRHCSSQLDCAPGRSCTAQGTCMAPIGS